MTDNKEDITEADLHAYADGFLDGEKMRSVEDWLKTHPQEAERVKEWQRQAEAIKTLFAGEFEGRPEDNALVRADKPTSPSAFLRKLTAIAAAVAIFAIGVTVGRFAPFEHPAVESVAFADALPDQSRSAFLIYTSEVRHPVEVGADQEDHLVQWLGKRLDHPLKAPDLRALGFHLVGGRLIPSSGEPGALLMYEDGSGRRLTLLVARNGENDDTSFRFAEGDGVDTFYWIDGPLGYAISATIGRARLRTIADEVYRQVFELPGDDGV